MYSVVLMLAVTAGGETPDFGRKGGCHGCCGYSSCHGCCGYSSCHGYKACHGCCGYSSCCGYSACHGCCGTIVIHGCCGGAAPAKKVEPKKISNTSSDNSAGVVQQGSVRPATATVIVNVHPTARLTVDGEATRSTSAVRTFETPELAPGKTFVYTMKAEFQLDGKPVSVTKNIKVEAGRTIRVDLSKPEVAVVSK